MTTHARTVASIIAAASCPALAQPGLRQITIDPDQPRYTVHYDLATGAMTTRPYEPPAAHQRAGTSGAVWLNNNDSPCSRNNQAWNFNENPDRDGDGFGDFFYYDQPCDDPEGWPCYGVWELHTGDIPSDTVVDRLVFWLYVYTMEHDSPCTAPGDGVEGCDLYITFSDADNGNEDPNRRCITEIRVPNLPGVGVQNCGVVPEPVIYELVIDLAPSQVFELGDADGVDDAGNGNSGAAIHGQPTYADLDSDGLHDFSYAVRIDQTAAAGNEQGTISFLYAAPKLGNPNDIPRHPAEARGIEDFADLHRSGPSCPPDTTELMFQGYFGGFTCDEPQRAFSSMYIEMYGPDAPPHCGLADVAEPFAVLDFSDILLFLTHFAEQRGWVRELAPSTSSANFSDVVVFLEAFAQGCP